MSKTSVKRRFDAPTLPRRSRRQGAATTAVLRRLISGVSKVCAELIYAARAERGPRCAYVAWPVKIDKDYAAKLEELPTPADKAAALEATLTAELSEDDPSFTYRQLGERLQRVKERKDAGDEATAKRLRELEELAAAAAATKQEPERLNLIQAGEYGLFTILRAHTPSVDANYLADCARRMVGHLRSKKLLLHGWSNSIGGRMRVEQSLLAESWNAHYAALGFDPDAADPPFLKPAVSELAKSDGTG
jgi:type I restriction enzyme R subunit